MLRCATLFVLLVGCQSSDPSPERASTAIAGSLERLEASVNELRDAVAARSSIGPDRSTPVEASASLAGPSPEASASIEVLRQALAVHERQRAIACENIANVEVAGYKRRRVEVRSARPTDTGLRHPEIERVSLAMDRGLLEATGNSWDLAIEGEGFFEIALPSGELRYTRDGAFRQNVNGNLVTAEGFLLNEDIAIPPDAIEVALSPTGEVFALMANNELVPQGTIRLATFANPGSLRAIGGNEFAPSASSGEPIKRLPGAPHAGLLRQGYLERSNVDMSSELIDLQLADRRIRAVQDALASFGIAIH